MAKKRGYVLKRIKNLNKILPEGIKRQKVTPAEGKENANIPVS
jgi:hypothetical protein